jgi:flagellar basal body-associated protein FliL
MKKVILMVAAIVLLGGGIAFYMIWSGAQKDTEAITTLAEGKMSKEQVGELQAKAADGIKAANQAAEAAKALGVDEQLKLWETQLGSGDAAVRMAALRELSTLHEKAAEKVEGLVKGIVAKETDEDVKMMAEMLLEEWSGGGDEAEGEAEGEAEAPAEAEEGAE